MRWQISWKHISKVKTYTVKLLQENIWDNLCNIKLGQDFLDETMKKKVVKLTPPKLICLILERHFKDMKSCLLVLKWKALIGENTYVYLLKDLYSEYKEWLQLNTRQDNI